MPSLTAVGQQKIDELAHRYHVSSEAIITLLQALLNSNGTMAQFNHPELGGMGQWLASGMIMIGDMFNQTLATKVRNLCVELSQLMQSYPLVAETTAVSPQSTTTNSQLSWWPAELGIPSASGTQNLMRYAYFATSHRLVIDCQGQISIYDTLNHNVGGVSQQQGSSDDLSFTSQYGTVNVVNLPLISGHGISATANEFEFSGNTEIIDPDDIFAQIEQLAELKQKGMISENKLAVKKSELLKQL